jgi:putative peptide zinc metalloprotease protein
VIGIALAIWMVATTIAWPLLKGVKFILLSPVLARVRWRAVLVTALAVGGIFAVLALLPIPNGTVVRGLVWIADDSRIVAEASGRLDQLLVEPGAMVAPGDAVAKLDDPLIAAKRKRAQALRAEIAARLLSAESRAPYDLQVLSRQQELADQELADLERQERNLIVRSPAAGAFIVPHALDLADNFIKRGQTIGFVMSDRAPSIRASVPEGEIEFVRTQTRSVSIRFDEAPWTRLDSPAIEREVPKSTRSLPAPALSTENGGPFTLDPAAKDKDIILESIFEVDIAVPKEIALERWGQRVWVRFDHGASPIIGRVYRAARQLFLGRFHV